MHLVYGDLGHLLRGELHDPGPPGLAGLVIEELDIGDLADLATEQVLHLGAGKVGRSRRQSGKMGLRAAGARGASRR